MKVFLVICLIVGVNSTLPGLSGGAGSNIVQDLLGGTRSFIQSIRGNFERFTGGGGGEIVDGKGSGIQGVGYQTLYGPPKPVYGPPKPVYGAPKPVYGPPKPVYGPPKQVYGAPKPVYGAPKPVYGPPKQIYGASRPVQQTFTAVEPQVSLPPVPVNPQQKYGPPPIQKTFLAVEPQVSYLPPAPINPQPKYGPPLFQETFTAVEPQNSYLPPQESGFSESGSSASSNKGGSSGLGSIFKYAKI